MDVPCPELPLAPSQQIQCSCTLESLTNNAQEIALHAHRKRESNVDANAELVCVADVAEG